MTNLATGQSNQTVCAGQSATLTATGGTSYNWSTGDTTATTVVTPTSTTQYWVYIFQNGNTSLNNVTVTVNPLPIANAGRDTSFCVGSFASLTATGGIHYLWNSGDTTATISSTPTNPGSGTFTVTVTNAYGCSSRDSVKVTVNPLPTASAGNDTSFCAGSFASLTATGGTHYLWSTGDTTATISRTLTKPATKTFTVTVTNAYGCSANASVKVTVNPLPIANIIPIGNVINEGRDTVFYSVGSYVCLVATGGTNYRWSTGDSTEFVSALVTQPISGIPVTVTVTNDYGCSASDSIVVTVKNNYQKVYNICSGQSLALHVLLGSGNPFLWSTGDSTDNINVSPDSSTTYFVTVTWSDNSLGVDSFKVNVKPEPIINIVADTISPGPGLPVTLTATGGTNMKYRWGKNTYGAVTTVFPANTTTYMVQGSDMYGCKGGGQVTITVNNNSIPAQSVYNICPGQTAQLTAPKGSSYSWSTGDSTATIIVFPPDSANKYFVTVTQPNSTSVIDSFMVNIKPEPVVSAGTNFTSPGVGAPVTLTATGGMRYYWSNGIGGNVISVSPAVTTIYTVTAYAKNGCSAAANVTVTVNDINSSSIFIGQDSTGRSIISTIPDSNLYIQSARTASTDTARNTIINSNNGGRVGIGTNNPTEKLTVNGNANISGDLIIGTDNSGANNRVSYQPATPATPSILSFGVPATIQFQPTTCYMPTGIIPSINRFTGMIESLGSTAVIGGTITNIMSMGFNGADGIIDISGANIDGISPRLFINHYCGKDVIIGGQNSNQGALISLHNTYLATEDGYVGIGTNNPIGNLTIKTATDKNLSIMNFWGTGNNNITITATNDNNSADIPLVFAAQSYYFHDGNVGIGTATPKDKLQIGNGANSLVYGSNSIAMAGLPDGDGDLGWSTSYLGFNAVRDNTYSSQPWLISTYSADQSNNGGGVIMNAIAGRMDFIPIPSSLSPSTNQTFSDVDLYKQRVMELYPIDPVSHEGGLILNGKITAKEVEITIDPTFWWSDYVFDKNYDLLPLNKLEKYITKNKHLPDVPSSSDVKEKGINVAEMDATLLKKIEEQMLYIIQLEKQLKQQQTDIDNLKYSVEKLKEK